MHLQYALGDPYQEKSVTEDGGSRIADVLVYERSLPGRTRVGMRTLEPE